MPATTPNRHYPYPLDADAMDIAGDIQDLAMAIDSDITVSVNSAIPGGSVMLTIAAAAPSGWALMQGQTLTGAQTAYPELWGLAPAAWKSGANLVLPDTRGRFVVSSGGVFPLGAIGGSSSRTLATANMPSHSHTGATASENTNHQHGGVDHLHGISLMSGASDRGLSTSPAGNHLHTFSQNPAPNNTIGPLLVANVPTTFSFGNGGTIVAYATHTSTPNVMDYAGEHTHSVSDHLHSVNGATGGADRSLTTGWVTANHQHAVYAEGGGQAFDISPAFFSLNLIIRLR